MKLDKKKTLKLATAFSLVSIATNAIIWSTIHSPLYGPESNFIGEIKRNIIISNESLCNPCMTLEDLSNYNGTDAVLNNYQEAIRIMEKSDIGKILIDTAINNGLVFSDETKRNNQEGATAHLATSWGLYGYSTYKSGRPVSSYLTILVHELIHNYQAINAGKEIHNKSYLDEIGSKSADIITEFTAYIVEYAVFKDLKDRGLVENYTYHNFITEAVSNRYEEAFSYYNGLDDKDYNNEDVMKLAIQDTYNHLLSSDGILEEFSKPSINKASRNKSSLRRLKEYIVQNDKKTDYTRLAEVPVLGKVLGGDIRLQDISESIIENQSRFGKELGNKPKVIKPKPSSLGS